mmetsp:Transcript_70885/g.162422  ORF Transcript_70885/g.162422 Transcript_70885/m.162422 type:complete len:221 (+) Transcript_70885:83-745(+)
MRRYRSRSNSTPKTRCPTWCGSTNRKWRYASWRTGTSHGATNATSPPRPGLQGLCRKSRGSPSGRPSLPHLPRKARSVQRQQPHPQPPLRTHLRRKTPLRRRWKDQGGRRRRRRWRRRGGLPLQPTRNARPFLTSRYGWAKTCKCASARGLYRPQTSKRRASSPNSPSSSPKRMWRSDGSWKFPRHRVCRADVLARCGWAHRSRSSTPSRRSRRALPTRS